MVLKFPEIRMFALMSHFILTIALLWTKFDPIQVSMNDPRDTDLYVQYERSYSTLISFGLVGLFFQFVFIISSRNRITALAALHVFLDFIACFFISWVILDGLDWREYGWILTFCVLLPVLLDFIISIQYFFKRLLVRNKRDSPSFATLCVNWVRNYWTQ